MGELDVPEPPKYLLSSSRAWWMAFWRSDLAKAVQADTDIGSLRRLADLYDQRERTRQTLRKEGGPVTTGSQGQLVLHPLAKYQAQCDAEIRQLEDRFGLNPRARLSLGLQLTQARRELKDLWNEPEDETPLEVVDLNLTTGDVTASARKVHRSRQPRR